MIGTDVGRDERKPAGGSWESVFTPTYVKMREKAAEEALNALSLLLHALDITRRGSECWGHCQSYGNHEVEG